jgi:hypothetical protein
MVAKKRHNSINVALLTHSCTHYHNNTKIITDETIKGQFRQNVTIKMQKHSFKHHAKDKKHHSNLLLIIDVTNDNNVSM